MMAEVKFDVLGAEYTLLITSESMEPRLAGISGFCDKTTRRIVVAGKDEDCDLEDFDVYLCKAIRHEVIHAFLFESGLHENFTHPQFGHDELYVDWIAAQWPKMQVVFEKLGVAR